MADPSAVDTWEALVRFHRATTQEMDRRFRQQFDRTLDDYDVLHQIRLQRAPMRMGELAEQLLVANSSCHRLVGRLVDAGLIERLPGQADRREVLVGLTAPGRHLHRRMAVAHTRDINELLGDALTNSQTNQLGKLLTRLQHHPRDHRP